MTVAIDLFIVAYLAFIALRQEWAMFAPDPTAQSTHLHVMIRLASGDAIRWDPPRFRSRWAAMRGFRRRLYELMLALPDSAAARRSLADYLVATYTSSDPAVDVVFVCTEMPAPAAWDFRPGEPVEFVIDTIPSG
jgi:hypothetical protein